MNRTSDSDGTIRYDGFVAIRESIDNKFAMVLERIDKEDKENVI